MNESFGKAPAGARGIKTFETFFSQKNFAGGSELPTTLSFFTSDAGDSGYYQNLVLPSPNSVPILVYGFRISLNLVFDPAASSITTDLTHPAMLEYLLQSARLNWQQELRIGSKGLPLHNLLSYDNYIAGSTLSTRVKNDWAAWMLPKNHRIEIPAGGRLSFFLSIPAGLKLVGNATSPAYLPTTGYTNARGHYIRLEMLAEAEQPLV